MNGLNNFGKSSESDGVDHGTFCQRCILHVWHMINKALGFLHNVYISYLTISSTTKQSPVQEFRLPHLHTRLS